MFNAGSKMKFDEGPEVPDADTIAQAAKEMFIKQKQASQSKTNDDDGASDDGSSSEDDSMSITSNEG